MHVFHTALLSCGLLSYIVVGCCAAYLLLEAMREAYVWDKPVQHPTFCLQQCTAATMGGCTGSTIKTTHMKPIGSLIKEELERQERTVSWFARHLSCDRSNVYRLFQKHSIDTDLLIRISFILNRDFFSEISENIKEKKLSQNPRHK